MTFLVPSQVKFISVLKMHIQISTFDTKIGQLYFGAKSASLYLHFETKAGRCCLSAKSAS